MGLGVQGERMVLNSGKNASSQDKKGGKSCGCGGIMITV